MKYIFFFSIIIFSYSATSQTFSEFDAGFEELAGQVDWLDIDSDGDLDLIISGLSKDDSGVSFDASILYINNGDGSFGEDNSIFENKINILDISDFNGDGDVDLLISEGGSSSGSTSIYVNNYLENGSFDLLAQINDFRGVGFFSDFDNDGDIDVVFSGQKLVQGRNGGWFFKTALYINENGGFTEQEFDD
ncbi:MAG: VCBS repeat-containing protein, partial [Ekhidna sp.]